MEGELSRPADDERQIRPSLKNQKQVNAPLRVGSRQSAVVVRTKALTALFDFVSSLACFSICLGQESVIIATYS